MYRGHENLLDEVTFEWGSVRYKGIGHVDKQENSIPSKKKNI